MMKFFRKHTKKLLAVFMALLLIVWLGGDAFEYMLGGSMVSRVIAQTAYGPIVQGDMDYAGRQTNLLTKMGIPWAQPLSGVATRAEPLTLADWILLTREADRYGISMQKSEAERFLANSGHPKEFAELVAQREDIQPDLVYAAIAKHLAVRQLASIVVSSAARSEAEVRLAARNELEAVKVNLVVLKASTFINPDETIPEDRVKAQFEKYRNEQDKGGLEFGYMQPAAVNVQYIKIDVNGVANQTRVRERTLESKAKEYWEQHRESPEFLRPPEPAKTEPPAEGAEAAEPEKPKSPYFETFEEAREIATKAVRRQFADSKITEIAGWLLRELGEPWFDAQVGTDGYKIATADIAGEGYYQSVLNRMPETLRFGDAVTVRSTGFLKQADVATKAPGIGNGFFAASAGGLRNFGDAAFRVQGVVPMPTEKGAPTSDYLAAAQTHLLAVSDYGGNLYVFRVLAVRPPGPPENLEEVRDKVIADLRLEKAYGEAMRIADKFKILVTPTTNLKAAFDGDAECQAIVQDPSGYFAPQPISRRPKGTSAMGQVRASSVEGIGMVDEEFIEKLFAMGSSTKLPRLEIMPVGKTGTVAVIEWLQIEPLRSDLYAAERPRLVRQLNRFMAAEVANAWLASDRIRDRGKWEQQTQ